MFRLKFNILSYLLKGKEDKHSLVITKTHQSKQKVTINTIIKVDVWLIGNNSLGLQQKHGNYHKSF